MKLSKEEIGKRINELELKNSKDKLDYQIESAKRASEQQRINLVTTFIAERSRLEVMALFGLAKIDG